MALLHTKLTREQADSYVSLESGKPPFYPFGRGNVTPVSDNNYMSSHSVNPEKPPNSPSKPQVANYYNLNNSYIFSLFLFCFILYI